MEHTLFGVIETKTETRERAKQLAEIYAALREAPGAFACRKGQWLDLEYFVRRAEARKMDENDRDGLLRLIGQPEDMLTAADCRQMTRNRKIWKRNMPGWIVDGWHCTTLHPKEIAYLKQHQAYLAAEMEAIKGNVPLLKAEAETLRAVGPISQNLADRHGLTVDGLPKIAIQETTNESDNQESKTVRKARAGTDTAGSPTASGTTVKGSDPAPEHNVRHDSRVPKGPVRALRGRISRRHKGAGR